MRLLNHENLLSLKNILDPGTFANFKELYVMSELMETDLSKMIKSKEPISAD